MTTKEAITTPDDPDLGAINQMRPLRTTITLYPFGENYGHTVSYFIWGVFITIQHFSSSGILSSDD